MNWYVAHIIMYVKFKDEIQDSYPIWENMILISADSDEEAMKKATNRAKEDEGDSKGSFKWNEREASWCFGGIRKLISCEDFNEKPTSGTELSYNEMIIEKKDDFEKLINGDEVLIKYIN